MSDPLVREAEYRRLLNRAAQELGDWAHRSLAGDDVWCGRPAAECDGVDCLTHHTDRLVGDICAALEAPR